jgi:hypothetical protein
MRYLLSIYGDERAFETLSPEALEANMQRWTDYTAWLQEQGWMQAGDALQSTDHATSVRISDGERVVTDGPFAETKEQLGGYYLIDVPNLDDAIEAAARCPGAVTGTIEVRPIMEFDAPEG